jgi:DNA-binding NarL/FixJ family response regulator
MKPIAILLVEVSPLFQSALSTILTQLGFSVTIAVERVKEPNQKFDVVLVDAATLSEQPGQLDAVVDEGSRAGPVLLLAREDHVEQVVAGLRAGAVGFLRQTASAGSLRAAIKTVAAGGTWCDITIFRKIIKYLPAIPSLKRARFTRREQEVLTCVGRGDSNKEIAQRLGVAEQSVKVYVSSLLRKTGASNRRDLGIMALAFNDVA